MAHDFWNTNLHPITMFKALSSQNIVRVYSKEKKKKRIQSINEDELKDYLISRELMEEIGIGAKKLKAYYLSLGELPKFINGFAFYKKSFIPQIKEMILKENPSIDMSDYISNGELKEMFFLSSYKAWDIAKKEGLIRKRFYGNVNYYEREKAIEAFSKYIKL